MTAFVEFTNVSGKICVNAEHITSLNGVVVFSGARYTKLELISGGSILVKEAYDEVADILLAKRSHTCQSSSK